MRRIISALFISGLLAAATVQPAAADFGSSTVAGIFGTIAGMAIVQAINPQPVRHATGFIPPQQAGMPALPPGCYWVHDGTNSSGGPHYTGVCNQQPRHRDHDYWPYEGWSQPNGGGQNHWPRHRQPTCHYTGRYDQWGNWVPTGQVCE